MNKTKIALILFAGSAILLTGCLPKKQTGTTQPQEEPKTVFESIKDAMTKSLSLQCDYTTNNVKSTVYIKGKMLRSETDTQQGKSYAILKENKLWSWGSKDKNGLIIDLSDAQSKTQTGQKSDEDIINEVEQHKQNCKPAVVSDSLFNPPADINFQDLSQMFKNFGATIKP